MEDKANCVLGIIVVIALIVIPKIGSTMVDTHKNVMSPLDGHDTSGSHLDICCIGDVGFILSYIDWTLDCFMFKFEQNKIRRNQFLWIGKETNRDTQYPRVESLLRWWNGFHFLWNLSKFKIFRSENVLPILTFFLIRYECLPLRDSERFTRDKELNIDVWTPLYQLKNGVSIIFILNILRVQRIKLFFKCTVGSRNIKPFFLLP